MVLADDVVHVSTVIAAVAVVVRVADGNGAGDDGNWRLIIVGNNLEIQKKGGLESRIKSGKKYYCNSPC